MNSPRDYPVKGIAQAIPFTGYTMLMTRPLRPSLYVRLGMAFFSITLLSSPLFAAAESVADKQALLQAQLDAVNAEIKQNQSQLSTKQKERTSLERDVAVLDYQITETQLEIKRRDITIEKIKSNIKQKQSGISTLDSQVSVGEQSIAELLRETNVIDNTSLAAKLLGGTLDQYFRELDDFGRIERALDSAFAKMALEKKDLSARKAALEDERQEQSDLLGLQVAQHNSLKSKEREKQTLVSTVKGQEKLYQNTIATKQRTAAQIQAALFALRDTSEEVSFGDIYGYAKQAGALTGVRPALILGILSEESNLGQNIGTGNWKVDMKAPRDTVPFLAITAALGLNPDTQPVSKKPWYGYGGAMGPAQFIPSTWVMYQDRIAVVTGQRPANPWDPRTAAFASALLLKDNGADAGTPEAERLAALRYLAGWKNASNPSYAFYGNDVMSLAAKFQNDINVVGS